MMDTDNNTMYLQISAGQGPKECGWVVARLAETIFCEGEKQNVKVEGVEHLAFDKRRR
jgi:peptide chain release factor